MGYQFLSEMVLEASSAARPPERLTVAESSERYVRLVNPGSYTGPWKNSTAPYLPEVMEQLTEHEKKAVCFVAPAQSGKALALDTPLPTPTGWTTMGDLEKGGFVIGMNGRPNKVTFATAVYHGRKCYRVHFDDGESLVCDASHDWVVYDHKKTRWADAEELVVRSTADMIEAGVRFRKGKRARFRVPNASPLQLDEKMQMIDPYIFGLWLGDGTTSGGNLTVSEGDLAYVESAFETRGWETWVKRHKNRAPKLCVKGLQTALVALGFCRGGAKRIPEAYLRGSERQRRELLRGLMDTDGTALRRRAVEIVQKQGELSDQIAELIVSLGYKTRQKLKYVNINGKVCGPYVRMTFTAADLRDVFRMPRKALSGGDTVPRPTQVFRRSIVSIEEVESVPVRCIAIAGSDKIYLAGRSMIPTHNTSLSLNWLVHSVVCDPLNFMIVEKTDRDARDFSRMRVDPMLLNCPEVRKRIPGNRHADNVFDKRFSSGMTLMLRSPTVNALAGKPIPRMAFSDYDRMDLDVGGEGSPYTLGQARTTTFGHFGMVFVESSPSHPITDPRWEPQTIHEAPPCDGVIGIYNQGDRRRWYWICVDCDEAFEPDFKLLRWPQGLSHFEAANKCWLECPHCHSVYRHDGSGNKPGKHGLNAAGLWLPDGQRRLKGGEIVGEARQSSISSFWIKGVAAAFKSWNRLVEAWLDANEHYERTASEEQLKGTTNVDQGVPYLPKHLESERLPEQIRERAVDIGLKEVPADVRFLVAAVDVQKHRFVVQVHGVSDGGDLWVIDRFDIKYSLDRDEMRPDQFRWVSPAYEAKDWRLLLREVLLKDYPLADKSGRRMAIKSMICDSGGLSGTTGNAYALWHWLRRGPQVEDEDYDEWVNEWTPGLNNRLALYKGDASTLARVILSHPESPRMAKGTGARGAPVLRCNANMLKDQLNSMLDRRAKGTGRIRFPKWLPISFYRELCAETRDLDGKWINPKGFRNESWDLFVMTLALLIERWYIGVETLDWSNPPDWAQPHSTNVLIFGDLEKSPIIHERRDDMSLEDLAKMLG